MDGLLNVFDIFDNVKEPSVTHYLNACSIPCIEYDNSLSIVLAPHASRRIHHYRWNPIILSSSDDIVSDDLSPTDTPPHPLQPQPTPSASLPVTPPERKRRLTATFIHFLGLKNSNSNNNSDNAHHSNNNNIPRASVSTGTSSTLLKKSSREFYKSVRIRRHSSYNDYGYACQMKTDQYIKQHNKEIQQKQALPAPDFRDRPQLIHSIRTTPLGPSAKEIINVALHGNRVATVNKKGDISLYALNGTTAARVTTLLLGDKQEWMENDDTDQRVDDDLSDGYDFVRSRLAMGKMGLVYGSKNGNLWWLDFGCRYNPITT